ncbi:hypothetical protein MMC17_009786 [Xylographa soralifera]|nr:hypothetical protein [Xylographa soralifera]
MVTATVANGIILGKTGIYMPWYAGGGILIVVRGALMYTVGIATSASSIYGYSVLIAMGAGGYSQASFSVAQAKVDPKLVSSATAFVGCGQMGGITLALAVANTIFINEAKESIQNVLPTVPASEILTTISGAGGSFFETLSSADKLAVLEGIVAAVDKTYIMVIVAGGVSVLLSIFMKREKLTMEA